MTRGTRVFKKGFSLIELIVVIAIIGLLASITAVSLGQSRQKADVAKATGDFRALSHALEMYRQDHDGELPPASGGITIADLVTNYLSEYIAQAPQITARMVASPNVYFYTNPVTDGKYYNCGSSFGNQEYFVYFTASQQAIDGNEFPKIYERGVETSPYEFERCIMIENN